MQNLTQKDKIILSILSALFIVPEIIWGAVRNQLYSLYSANFSHYSSSSDFLSDSTTRAFIIPVLYIQFIGILLSLIFLIYKRKNISNHRVFWSLIVILGILVVLTFAVCLIAYAVTHVTVSF